MAIVPRIECLPVPGQLRELLRDLRVTGVMFERAWDRAWQQIVWPDSARETEEWERALDGTKETWRARYEQWEPTPEEQAVVGLVDAMSLAEAEAA